MAGIPGRAAPVRRACVLAPLLLLLLLLQTTCVLLATGMPFEPAAFGVGMTPAVAWSKYGLLALSFEDGKSGVRVADKNMWDAGGLLWETPADDTTALGNLRFLTVTATFDPNHPDSMQRMFMGAGDGYGVQIFTAPVAPRQGVVLGDGWLQQIVNEDYDGNFPRISAMAASSTFLFYTVEYPNDWGQGGGNNGLYVFNMNTLTSTRMRTGTAPWWLDQHPSLGLNGLAFHAGQHALYASMQQQIYKFGISKTTGLIENIATVVPRGYNNLGGTFYPENPSAVFQPWTPPSGRDYRPNALAVDAFGNLLFDTDEFGVRIANLSAQALLPFEGTFTGEQWAQRYPVYVVRSPFRAHPHSLVFDPTGVLYLGGSRLGDIDPYPMWTVPSRLIETPYSQPGLRAAVFDAFSQSIVAAEPLMRMQFNQSTARPTVSPLPALDVHLPSDPSGGYITDIRSAVQDFTIGPTGDLYVMGRFPYTLWQWSGFGYTPATLTSDAIFRIRAGSAPAEQLHIFNYYISTPTEKPRIALLDNLLFVCRNLQPLAVLDVASGGMRTEAVNCYSLVVASSKQLFVATLNGVLKRSAAGVYTPFASAVQTTTTVMSVMADARGNVYILAPDSGETEFDGEMALYFTKADGAGDILQRIRLPQIRVLQKTARVDAKMVDDNGAIRLSFCASSSVHIISLGVNSGDWRTRITDYDPESPVSKFYSSNGAQFPLRIHPFTVEPTVEFHEAVLQFWRRVQVKGSGFQYSKVPVTFPWPQFRPEDTAASLFYVQSGLRDAFDGASVTALPSIEAAIYRGLYDNFLVNGVAMPRSHQLWVFGQVSGWIHARASTREFIRTTVYTLQTAIQSSRFAIVDQVFSLIEQAQVNARIAAAERAIKQIQEKLSEEMSVRDKILGALGLALTGISVGLGTSVGATIGVGVLSTAVDATTFSLEAKEEGDFESSALPTSDYVHQLAMQKPASSPIRREAVLKALLDTGEAILPNLQKSIDRVLDNYAMTRIVADLASVSDAFNERIKGDRKFFTRFLLYSIITSHWKISYRSVTMRCRVQEDPPRFGVAGISLTLYRWQHWQAGAFKYVPRGKSRLRWGDPELAAFKRFARTSFTTVEGANGQVMQLPELKDWTFPFWAEAGTEAGGPAERNHVEADESRWNKEERDTDFAGGYEALLYTKFRVWDATGDDQLEGYAFNGVWKKAERDCYISKEDYGMDNDVIDYVKGQTGEENVDGKIDWNDFFVLDSRTHLSTGMPPSHPECASGGNTCVDSNGANPTSYGTERQGDAVSLWNDREAQLLQLLGKGGITPAALGDTLLAANRFAPFINAANESSAQEIIFGNPGASPYSLTDGAIPGLNRRLLQSGEGETGVAEDTQLELVAAEDARALKEANLPFNVPAWSFQVRQQLSVALAISESDLLIRSVELSRGNPAAPVAFKLQLLPSLSEPERSRASLQLQAMVANSSSALFTGVLQGVLSPNATQSFFRQVSFPASMSAPRALASQAAAPPVQAPLLEQLAEEELRFNLTVQCVPKQLFRNPAVPFSAVSMHVKTELPSAWESRPLTLTTLHGYDQEDQQLDGEQLLWRSLPVWISFLQTPPAPAAARKHEKHAPSVLLHAAVLEASIKPDAHQVSRRPLDLSIATLASSSHRAAFRAALAERLHVQAAVNSSDPSIAARVDKAVAHWNFTRVQCRTLSPTTTRLAFSDRLRFAEFELAVSLVAFEHHVYVADLFANAVLRVHSATLARDETFRLPVSAPIALALDAKRSHLYVASASLGVVQRAELPTRATNSAAFDTCFSIAVNAVSLALSPDSDVLYVLAIRGSRSTLLRVNLDGTTPLQLDGEFALDVAGCSAVTVVSSIDGEEDEYSVMCANGRGVHRIRVAAASGVVLGSDQIAALPGSGSPTSISAVHRTRANSSIVSDKYANPQVRLEAGAEFGLVTAVPQGSGIDFRLFAHATEVAEIMAVNGTCPSLEVAPVYREQPFTNTAVRLRGLAAAAVQAQRSVRSQCSTQTAAASGSDSLFVRMHLQVSSETAVSQLVSSSDEYNWQLVSELALSLGEPIERFQLFNSSTPQVNSDAASAMYELLLDILAAESAKSAVASAADVVTALQLQPLHFLPPINAQVITVQLVQKEDVQPCRGGGDRRSNCSFITARARSLVAVHRDDSEASPAPVALSAGPAPQELSGMTAILFSVIASQGVLFIMGLLLWRRQNQTLAQSLSQVVPVAAPSSAQKREFVTSPATTSRRMQPHLASSALRPPLTPRPAAMASRTPVVAGGVTLTPPLKERSLLQPISPVFAEHGATLGDCDNSPASARSPAPRLLEADSNAERHTASTTA